MIKQFSPTSFKLPKIFAVMQHHNKMIMMMIINYFFGMVNRRKTLGLISRRNHCQRSSPLQISDTPQAGFEPAQNLNLDEWSYAVVITTTLRCYFILIFSLTNCKSFTYTSEIVAQDACNQYCTNFIGCTGKWLFKNVY